MKRFPAAGVARRGVCSVKLLVLVGAILVLLAAAWVLLLPRVVASTVRRQTGFEVKVQRLWINPFAGNVEMRGLVVENPASWPVREFIDLREFRAKAKLWPLLKSRLEADEVVLDLARITLVRRGDGVLNAVKFKDGYAAGGENPVEPKPEAKPGEPQSATKFHIKRLVVRIDHITYADHSRGQTSVREYPVGINRELKDVDTVAELLSPLSTGNVAVMSEVLNDSVGMLRGTGDALKEAGQKASESVKGFLDKLKPKN